MQADAPTVGSMLESSIYVADLDRSAAFYCSLFGFEQYLRDERMCALGVPGGSVLLIFVDGGSEAPSHTPNGMIPGHGARGRTHLCFRIAEVDIEDWQRLLEQRGIALESRVTWQRGGTSLYFRDPDGHSVEVASPGLWPCY